MSAYSKPLKVSTPEGKRVVALINRTFDNVLIEIPFLEVVLKDEASFSRNGVIHINVPRKKYMETINLLTKYLEDLFLKGMADEDIYSSLGATPKPRRVEKPDPVRAVIDATREGGGPGVRARAGGSKPTASPRRRKSKPKVAEGDNSSPEGLSKERD